MNLNLEKVIFSSDETQNFSSKFKQGYDIALAFQKRIKPLIKNNYENILQTFQPICATLKNRQLYVGDSGGAVLQLNESLTFEMLYQHQQQVNQIINRQKTNQIISCSSDGTIVLFPVDDITDKISIESSESVFHLALNENAKILYSSGKSGLISCWNLIANNKLKTLNTEDVETSSLTFSEELHSLFVSNVRGRVYIHDTFSNKFEIVDCADHPITSLAIQPNLEKFFISTVTGQISGWSIQTKKRQMILPQHFQHKICQILFFNLNMELVALGSQGAIIRMNIYENKYDEYRKYYQDGEYRAIFDPEEDSFYLFGHKNQLEKWNFNTGVLLESFERQEISSLDTYSFFYFSSLNENLSLITKKGYLVQYQIKDHIPDSKVLNKIFLQTNFLILGAFHSKDFIFIVCESTQLIILERKTHKELKRISLPYQDIVAVQVIQSGKKTYLFTVQGNLLTLDMQTYSIQSDMFEQSSSEIIFALLSQSEKNVFILKQQGNIIIKALDSKKKIFNMILNDENITSFHYHEEQQVLYTGDIGGAIVQTTFPSEDKCNSVILLDKNVEISSISVDKENQIMAFATKGMKIHIYDLKKNFFFDQLGKTYFNISYMFFTQNSDCLVSIGSQGQIQMWELKNSERVITLESLQKNVDIKLMALNHEFLFTLTLTSLNIWSFKEQKIIRILNENYSDISDMIMAPNGEFIVFCQNKKLLKIWDCVEFIDKQEINDFQDDKILSIVIEEQSKEMALSFASRRIIIYNLDQGEITSDFIFDMQVTDLRFIGKQLIGEILPGQYCVLNIDGSLKSVVGKYSTLIKGYVVTKDKNTIITVFRDGSVQVWDIHNSEMIFQFAKNEIPVNEVIDSEDGNILFVLGNAGQVTQYSMKTGEVISEFKMGVMGKVHLLKRFGNHIVFIANNNPQIISPFKQLTFYEKQYIKKTFMEFGKTGSEKNFISFFTNIKDYYENSQFLQNYFNPFFACALFNYQRGLQNILEMKTIKYPMLNDGNQVSPLVLALKLEYLNLAELILSTLIQNYIETLFSNREMKVLMDSKYEFTHKYLSYFFIQMKQFTGTDLNIPILSKLPEEYRLKVQFNSPFTPKKYAIMTQPPQSEAQKTLQQSQNLLSQDLNQELTQQQKNKLVSTLKGQLQGNLKSFNISRHSTDYSVAEQQLEQTNQVQVFDSWVPTKFY